MSTEQTTTAEVAQGMPAPRLQLRWVKSDKRSDMAFTDDSTWECHYELVLPLEEYDIRREIWKDGEEVGRRDALVIPIKKPTIRTSQRVPSTLDGGKFFYDAPYRDGAHAAWDAALLGSLPVFMIAPDGRYLQYVPREAKS